MAGTVEIIQFIGALIQAWAWVSWQLISSVVDVSAVQVAWEICQVLLAMAAIALAASYVLAGLYGLVLGLRALLCALLGWAGKARKATTSAPMYLVELVVGLYRWPWVAVMRLFMVKPCEHKYVPLLPVDEDKAVFRKEMANPNCPSKPAVWPRHLVSLLNAEGRHVGFGSYVHTAYGFHLMTAVHVMNAARSSDGKIRVSNGSGKMFELTDSNSRVVRGSRAFDQVHIEGPSALGSLLSLKAVKPTLFDLSKPVTVYSPSVEGVESSTSMATSPRGGKIAYVATTIPGSSGSPIMQGDHIVGIHVEGRKVHGVVRNSGYGILGYLARTRILETTSKAAQLAWQAEHEEDFAADEGFEEIDDFLDYKPSMRRHGVFFSGKGSVITTGLSKPLSGNPWKPASGVYWADMSDDDDMEQGNGRPGSKTSAQAQPKEASSNLESCEQRFSTPDGKRKKSRKTKPKASKAEAASPPSVPIPRSKAPASLKKRPESSQSSGSGQPQTAALPPSGEVSSTKPTIAQRPNSPARPSEPGSSSKLANVTQEQSKTYLRLQAAKLELEKARRLHGTN
jgi:hypothetical protein